MRGLAVAAGVAALALSSAAPAQPASAEGAMAAQQKRLRAAIERPCPTQPSDEIVVCGRTGVDPDRLPLRGERMPGERIGLIAGEAPTGANALAVTADECSNVGPQPRCGGSINFIAVGIVLLKAARHVVDPNSDPSPPPIPSDPYSDDD